VNWGFELSKGHNNREKNFQKRGFAFRVLSFPFSSRKRRRLMGAEKSTMAITTRDRDRELLIPVSAVEGPAASSSLPSSSSSSSPHHPGREVISLSTLSQFGFSILTITIRSRFLFFFPQFGQSGVLWMYWVMGFTWKFLPWLELSFSLGWTC